MGVCTRRNRIFTIGNSKEQVAIHLLCCSVYCGVDGDIYGTHSTIREHCSFFTAVYGLQFSSVQYFIKRMVLKKDQQN